MTIVTDLVKFEEIAHIKINEGDYIYFDLHVWNEEGNLSFKRVGADVESICRADGHHLGIPFSGVHDLIVKGQLDMFNNIEPNKCKKM